MIALLGLEKGIPSLIMKKQGEWGGVTSAKQAKHGIIP